MLNFSSVVINNSKNDCLDFSYGKYEVKNIELNNCGDKGVSAGENSDLYINNERHVSIPLKITILIPLQLRKLNKILWTFSKPFEYPTYELLCITVSQSQKLIKILCAVLLRGWETKVTLSTYYELSQNCLKLNGTFRFPHF